MSPAPQLQHPIKAIIGLGNPGSDYAPTRHNVGAWFVHALSEQYQAPMRPQAKLLGQHSKATIHGQAIHLFSPSTYMNRSGQAIAALCNFYKLRPQDLLIAHDELDFAAGITRYKYAGGHGGHNGLRDTIKALNSADFFRLRIGIGHPGNKHQVADYVLKRPSKDDQIEITSNIDKACRGIDAVVNGRWEQAMLDLHSS